MSAGEGEQTYHLADGLLAVRGEGAARDLLDHHLVMAGRSTPDRRPVLVSVELVDSAERHGVAPGGHVVRSRKGCAVITDATGDDPVHVRWERRLTTARPLIVAAHLAARRRNAVLLHAATVAASGRAVAVAGPSGGGKTSAALAAMAGGAALVAPEWTWVDVTTRTAHGLPQPLRVRPHHAPYLSQLPHRPGMGLLRAARVLPAPLRRRLHVDVPFADITAEPSAVELVAMIVLSTDGPSSDLDPVAAVAAATADDLAGVESPGLVTELAAGMRVVAGSVADVPSLVAGR